MIAPRDEYCRCPIPLGKPGTPGTTCLRCGHEIPHDLEFITHERVPCGYACSTGRHDDCLLPICGCRCHLLHAALMHSLAVTLVLTAVAAALVWWCA